MYRIYWLCFIFSMSLVAQQSPGDAKPDTTIRLEALITKYAPSMSSTVGIPLVVKYPRKITEDIKFYWQTNYGYFVEWQKPDSQVKKLGDAVINNGDKIYWSYSGNTKPDPKTKVVITLMIIDTGEMPVAVESICKLKIGWKDNLAVVLK